MSGGQQTEGLKKNDLVLIKSLPKEKRALALILDIDDDRAYVTYVTGLPHDKYKTKPLWISKEQLEKL